MTHLDEIASTLRQLVSARDQIATARQLVLTRGGQWPDETEISGLFELQLLGFAGVGIGAGPAIKNWIAQAEAVLEAASAQPA